ncbi:MAG: SCP2 sterol-binding domain-containing protein [Marinomonas colpomeniae]
MDVIPKRSLSSIVFDTLKEVVVIELGGMTAFMQGKIGTDGDIMRVTKLIQILPL